MGATEDSTTGWVKNANRLELLSAVQELRQDVSLQIDQIAPSLTLAQLIGERAIIQSKAPMLAASLPYALVAVGSRYSELPRSLRHYLTIESFSNSLAEQADDADLHFSASLPSVAAKRITFAYDPATADDEQGLVAYLDGDVRSIPAYQFVVKPTIRANGAIVAVGSSLPLGQRHPWRVDYISPGRDTFRSSNIGIAGTYSAIVPQLGRISSAQFDDIQTRVSSVRARYEADQFAGLTKDDFAGEMLYVAGLSYWAQSGMQLRLLSAQSGIAWVPTEGVGLFSWDADVSYAYGVPRSATVGGLTTDIDILTLTAVDKRNASTRAAAFSIAAGLALSKFEGYHWDMLLNGRAASGAGHSAVQVLELANQQGQKIFQIDSRNLSAALNAISLGASAEEEIANAVSVGRVVFAHSEMLQIGTWVGVGYAVVDPETGSGAYRISGGLNGGGYSCQCFGLSPGVEFIIGLLLGIAGEIYKRFALPALILGVALALAGLAASYCEIDKAKCLTDDDREILKSGVLAMFLIGLLLGGLAFALAGGAFVVFFALTVLTLALTTAQVIITDFGIPWAQRNRGC
jgi:hypothetical protein